MIFTLNCLIAKSLPNYLAGKMEPPGIFEWLLGVASCQKFARLQRLVLKNLAYAVLSLCNVLRSLDPGRFLHTYQGGCGAFEVKRACSCIYSFGHHEVTWQISGVPRNVLSFCLQSSAGKYLLKGKGCA